MLAPITSCGVLAAERLRQARRPRRFAAYCDSAETSAFAPGSTSRKLRERLSRGGPSPLRKMLDSAQAASTSYVLTKRKLTCLAMLRLVPSLCDGPQPSFGALFWLGVRRGSTK
jgi:hypothetical protein